MVSARLLKPQLPCPHLHVQRQPLEPQLHLHLQPSQLPAICRCVGAQVSWDACMRRGR